MTPLTRTRWTTPTRQWELLIYSDNWWEIREWSADGNHLHFAGWWPPQTPILDILCWLAERDETHRTAQGFPLINPKLP